MGAVDGVGQCGVQLLVVLGQWVLLVGQHQFLQGAVQVVGLGKAVARLRVVDLTMPNLPLIFGTGNEKAWGTKIRRRKTRKT